MTAAERVYRAACHAYPRSYRVRCASEIVSTALAASADRGISLREVVALVVGGARRRQLDAGSRGPRGVMSAGLTLAALVVIGAFAVSNAVNLLLLFTPQETMDHASELVVTLYLLAELVAWMALLRGYRRLAIAVAMLFAIVPVVLLALGHAPTSLPGWVSYGGANVSPLLLLLISARLGDRRSGRGSWGWLLMLVTATGITFKGHDVSLYLAVLVVALLLSTIDPRVAAATAATLGIVLVVDLPFMYGPTAGPQPLAIAGITLTVLTAGWAAVRTRRSIRAASSSR